MPSIEVASNEARMERIFKLYDMGCGLKHDALKRESHKLLWLLPLSNLVRVPHRTANPDSQP